jgi:HEPN domain-containing protein
VWSEGIPEEFYSAEEASEAIESAQLVLEWVERLWRRLSGREQS